MYSIFLLQINWSLADHNVNHYKVWWKYGMFLLSRLLSWWNPKSMFIVVWWKMFEITKQIGKRIHMLTHELKKGMATAYCNVVASSPLMESNLPLQNSSRLSGSKCENCEQGYNSMPGSPSYIPKIVVVICLVSHVTLFETCATLTSSKSYGEV